MGYPDQNDQANQGYTPPPPPPEQGYTPPSPPMPEGYTPPQGTYPPPPPPPPPAEGYGQPQQQQYQQPPQQQYQQPQQQYPQGGYPPPAGYPLPPQASPYKGRAVAALVLGILSIVFCWTPAVGLILGVVGLIVGIQARKLIPRGMDGAGMALAGFIVSIVGVVLGVIWNITYVAVCASGLAYYNWYY